MLLFRPFHVYPILKGIKVHTRRLWEKPRVRIGSLHRAKLRMMSPDYFALLRVDGLYRQVLRDMPLADYHKEGGYSRAQFRAGWGAINGPWQDDLEVWVVEFTMLEAGPAIPLNAELQYRNHMRLLQALVRE
jgi:hypothetical protein